LDLETERRIGTGHTLHGPCPLDGEPGLSMVQASECRLDRACSNRSDTGHETCEPTLDLGMEWQHRLEVCEREADRLERAKELERESSMLERERSLRQRELDIELKREKVLLQECALQERERELDHECQAERDRELEARARDEQLERQLMLERSLDRDEHAERNCWRAEFEPAVERIDRPHGGCVDVEQTVQFFERERALRRREMKLELQRERALRLERSLEEREKDLERERELEFERALEHERELDRERARELERHRHLERERVRELERERSRELERERTAHRERAQEFQYEREVERERRLKCERELEHERQLGRERAIMLDRGVQSDQDLELDKACKQKTDSELHMERDSELHLEIERDSELHLGREPERANEPELEAAVDETLGAHQVTELHEPHLDPLQIEEHPLDESVSSPDTEREAQRVQEVEQPRATESRDEPEVEDDAEASEAAVAAAAAAAALENKRLRRELEGLRALAHWQQGEVGAAIAYSGMACSAAATRRSASSNGSSGGRQGFSTNGDGAAVSSTARAAALSAVSDSELSGPQLAQQGVPNAEGCRQASPTQILHLQQHVLQAGIDEYDRTVRTLMSRVLGRSGEIWNVSSEGRRPDACLDAASSCSAPFSSTRS